MSAVEGIARSEPDVALGLHPAVRVLRVAAPVAFAVAFGASIAAWGLPLARDQQFFWLGLAMAAFSVATWRSWGMMVLEWLPLFGLLVAYDYLRGAVSMVPADAHVLPQLDFDRWLFGGETPTEWLQHRLFDVSHVHWYDYGIWGVYMTHFFAVWVVAAVLWKVAHEHFRRYVALTVLVTGAALMTYWLYPAQPPWLAADEGLITPVTRIVPEVWGQLGVPSAGSLFENGSGLANLVAAMPSLHASYPLMLLLFFWPAGLAVRILLGVYTLAMAFTLVYGGEHFFIDILVGWIFTLAAFAIVTLTWRALERRRLHAPAHAGAFPAEPGAEGAGRPAP